MSKLVTSLALIGSMALASTAMGGFVYHVRSTSDIGSPNGFGADGQADVYQSFTPPDAYIGRTDIPPIYNANPLASSPAAKSQLTANLVIDSMSLDAVGYNDSIISIGIGRGGQSLAEDDQIDGFNVHIALATDFFYLQVTEEAGFQSDSPWVAFPTSNPTGPLELDIELDYWEDNAGAGSDYGFYEARVTDVNAVLPSSPSLTFAGASWNSTTRTATLTGTYGDAFVIAPGPVGVLANAIIFPSAGTDNYLEYTINSMTHSIAGGPVDDLTSSFQGTYILEENIPEPATLGLLALGLLGVARRR